PQDEAPHPALAEWWYYTGHLYTPNAGGGEAEYGFELVFFRAVRGERPPGYAAHFAVTDLPRERFAYDQRQDVALNEASGARPAPAPGADGALPVGTVSRPLPGGGFDLSLGGWRVAGRDGQDVLQAAMPGYALDVSLSATRPPVLHLGDPPQFPGLISFGPAGYSYYYSRTRMTVDGTLTVDGAPLAVRGDAWMDHQWGDFLVLGGGGWDWFAGNLHDGRDLTCSIVRDAAGQVVLAYGTLVEADGRTRHLGQSDLRLTPVGWWTSPRTGVRYPSGWRLTVPDAAVDLRWVPLLQDQELDTRASTGVVYWEGAVRLEDAAGQDAGRGYVELTGYTASR
ncbi:MAG TPA: lipocalin family protein, partial [Chloroflexota bacterium]|nr:lipocalin family protein [Chloroflexota bacterium]